MSIPATSILDVELVAEGTVTVTGGINKVISNVFHFKRTTIVTSPSKTSFETAFNTNITAPFLLAVNVDFTQTRNRVRWLNDAEDQYLDITRAGVGAVTGDRLPTDTAVYFNFRTALRGPNYRGNKHFAPLSESDIGDDYLNAGSVTLWDAVRDALAAGFTDADGNNWRASVFSRTLSVTTPNPTTIVNTQATSILINKRVGVMGRRRVSSSYV